MQAKFHEIGDRALRLSLFVPDIGGPRALPMAGPLADAIGHAGREFAGGYVRRHLPRWSK